MTQPAPPAKAATVHYGDGEFAILAPGNHVLCAVTQKPIPLVGLRYWSVEWQEAYMGPAEYLRASQTRADARAGRKN